jgi:diguanylate cyclase
MNDDKNSIYHKIIAIHDEALIALNAMHVPPYPIHYEKQFNRIFNSLSDNVLKNALNQDQAMDDKINSIGKYIELAKIAVETFTQSHSNITHVAEQQTNILHSYKSTEDSSDTDHVSIIDGLMVLGNEMANELKKSEEKIIELNERLDDVLLDVTTDPLTHLLNHRKYMEDLGNILPNGLDHPLPLLSLMINADNFKDINLKYGHTAGDKVLYFLAQTIKGMVRAGDIVYRYGGDQFAVLLNRCEESKVMGIAEKLLHKVENSHLIYSGKSIELTVSIGATMHKTNDDIDRIIQRTEDALSNSKKEGKNKITLQ